MDRIISTVLILSGKTSLNMSLSNIFASILFQFAPIVLLNNHRKKPTQSKIPVILNNLQLTWNYETANIVKMPAKFSFHILSKFCFKYHMKNYFQL